MKRTLWFSRSVDRAFCHVFSRRPIFRARVLLGTLALCWLCNPVPTEAFSRSDFRQTIRESKQSVFPTVVFIRVLREMLEVGQASRQEVSGSGVLISPCGELLTNWHVVDKAAEIRCLLHDGRVMRATITAADKDLDLALLQLEMPSGALPLAYAKLGDSDAVREGDFVMAMGAPWGLSRSVSIGIVSCRNRYLPDLSTYNLWIQTDASISPGNSGGPLVDTSGAVIGINTRGVLLGGDTGFAIPSAVILEVLPRMRQMGRVGWMYTGIELQPLNDFNRNIFFDYDQGVMVASVDPASPAEAAGLKTGDRILSMNGTPITAVSEESVPDIRRHLALQSVSAGVMMHVQRGEIQKQIEVVPIDKGDVEGEEMDFPQWDFTVKTINRFHTPDLFFYRQEGVFVFGVRRPGNAMRAGLRTRDVLLEIDGAAVHSLGDLRQTYDRAMERRDETTRVFLSVLRFGSRHQIVLDFSRDFQ